MADDRKLRDQMQGRWSGLETERSSWVSHWRDISEHLLPRTGRFIASDRNRGDKRHNRILDNTGTRALRVLSAGMMAGMTSPARPWFRLTTSDPQLDESAGVKVWLADVTRIMQMIFAKSNTYRALHSACKAALDGIAKALGADDSRFRPVTLDSSFDAAGLGFVLVEIGGAHEV